MARTPPLTLIGLDNQTLSPLVAACFNQAYGPTPSNNAAQDSQELDQLQTAQLDAILALTANRTFTPMPAYQIHPPGQDTTWADIFTRLPQPVQGIGRFSGLLASPQALHSVKWPHDVNLFLRAIQLTFPHPYVHNREVAANTLAGLNTLYVPDLPANSSNSTGVASGYSLVTTAVTSAPGARHGSLWLVASGPNLIWESSTPYFHLKTLMAAAHGDELAALQQITTRACEYFKAGKWDWHELGIFLFEGRMYVYDPSAVPFNHSSTSVVEHFTNVFPGNSSQQARPIEASRIANFAMASQLAREGWRDTPKRGRFGKRSSAKIYIGGGGNTGGYCRAMVGSWLVLVAALCQDAYSPKGMPRTQEMDDARENLDFLLGGFVSGQSNGASSRSPWWSVRLN